MRNKQEGQQIGQFDRKKLCRYYAMGKCKFGKQCRLSHQIVKCYLIRHAESSFNQALHAFEHQSCSNEAKQRFQTDQSFIDCGITQKGISQIDNMTFPEQIRNTKLKFDLIFVSPLERCLKTAQRCINKYKIKSNKTFVLAGLTEVMSKICDFGLSIKEKINRFPQFDFSCIQYSEKQWQDFLVDPQFRQKIQKQQKFAKRYLKILHEIFPQPLQSSERCFKRTLQTIDEIKKICSKEKAENILIFSHNRIIKYVMGRYRNGISKSVQNCQIKFTFLQKEPI